jgi:biotin carboxylase
MKPNRSSGSKGIFRIETVQQFNSFSRETLGYSLDGMALVEQYVVGSQHTGEGILDGGKVSILLVTDRLTAPAPYVATWGHKVPSALGQGSQVLARSFLEATFGLLGLSDGPFDCDFVFAPDGRLFLLEASPRLGGNSLSSLFDAALGTDILRYAIDYALAEPGRSHLPQSVPKAAAIALLGVMGSGRAQWNPEACAALAQEPGVMSFAMDVIQGNQAEPFINGRRRLGEILMAADNRQELDILYKKVHDILDLKVTK